MKTNSLHDALSAFLEANPDLPRGEENSIQETTEKKKAVDLHVAVEKKGRNGKTATIVYGLSPLSPDEIASLAQDLKKHLGTGGSFRGEEILIQGNMREKVVEFLNRKGYRVK